MSQTIFDASDRRINDARWKGHFQRNLLNWYALNRRDLPWRASRDPYRIWISEIMLQQTRVAAVIPHYQRFLRRFPTINKLARARESSVLAAWSGLGYYRRARHLHAASKEVMKQHGGEVPRDRAKLSALAGIGRYTSAAIASIAFGDPVAAVDGNVRRVLERILGKVISGEKLWETAEGLLSHSSPGDFNQAMMELGATVCLPRQPKCLLCPVTRQCATRGSFPKTATQRRRKKTIYYTVDYRKDSVFLVKRQGDASLMPGMWEFPETPQSNINDKPWMRLRHSITVTDYEVLVMQAPAPAGVAGKWVSIPRAPTLPLTGLARKILRAADFIQ